MQVVGDVMSGRNVKESLSGIKRTVGDVISQKPPLPKKEDRREERKKERRVVATSLGKKWRSSIPPLANALRAN